jgi:succinate dehydrogenase / fumarate reductase, cytochrome b subunit
MNNSMSQAGPVHRSEQTAGSHQAVTGNRLAVLWSTVIGKKIVMAITGSVLFLFVIMHMIGNLKIFLGPNEINAYAAFLREVGRPELEYGQLLWIVRIVLLVCLILHVTAVVQLTRMNQKARPVGYGMKKNAETTFAALTMRWGGFLLLAFVVLHLLHLTAGAIGFKPGQFKHLAVYQNVLATFSAWPIVLLYVVAMAALCLHLYHGIWSALQTFGFNNSRNTRTLKTVSRLIALVVFLGFISVPVSVLAGWLR